MARDYAAEFRKLFSNGCTVQGWDWNAPRYFDSTENDCYSAEAALVSELTSEAYNNFGFEVLYYIKAIDTKIDRLYGEDPLENIERRFKLQMYTDSIPTMQKSYDLQGMIYNELITCQCTVQHFYEASQLSYPDMQDIYEAEVPRIGDIVYMEYSDTYYEVVNVKQFADSTTFLSTPMTYTFILRVWRNNHEDVDVNKINPDKMEEFNEYASLGETFNLDLKDTEEHNTAHVQADATEENGKIKEGSDMLAINEDLKRDETLKYSEEGEILKDAKDNVESHVVYNDKEVKEENPEYYDPFGGW